MSHVAWDSALGMRSYFRSYAVDAGAHRNARCHPDRSAAEWRGLPAHEDARFLAEFTLSEAKGSE